MSITTSATGGYLQPADKRWDDPQARMDQFGDFFDRSSPPYDDVLEAFFQKYISGVTGIDGTLVRPRWQPVPPNMPIITTNWCAFGVQVTSTIGYAYVEHQSRTFDQPGATFDDGRRYADNASDAFDVGSFDIPGRVYDRGIAEYDKPGRTFDDGETFDVDAAKLQRDITLEQEELDIICSFYGPQASRMAARFRSSWQVPQNREPLQLKGMGFVSASELRRVPDFLNEQWYNRVDNTASLRRAILRSYPVFDIISLTGTIVTDQSPLRRTISTSPPPLQE